MQVGHFLRRLVRVVSLSHANERPHPVGYDWFSENEIAGYEQSFPTNDVQRIDDATWRDLDVNAYLRLIGGNASIFGRQMMYARLRRGAMQADFPDSPLKSADQVETDQVLAQTLATRDSLRLIDVDVTQMLFHRQLVTPPSWATYLWLVPVFGLAALLLAKSQLGILTTSLVIAYLVMNAWTQIKLYKPLNSWKRQRDSVMTMLNALDLELTPFHGHLIVPTEGVRSVQTTHTKAALSGTVS